MLVASYAFALAVLLIFWSGCDAQLQAQQPQRGYNYVRPELATTAGGGAPAARLTPSVYPTGTALPLTPAPATAYGAGLFPSPAVGYTPSGQATTAFGAPASPVNAAANLPRRPTATGVQGSSSTRSGPYGPQPQYGNTAVSSTGTRISPASTYNDDTDGDYSAIPGDPGVDYPVYAQVPRTNFDCAQQPLPGYYADIEAQCQVFHICALNRTYSFLCPNGTVFSQETLVCVWWNQYDCVSAPSLYANNAYIYDYNAPNAGNVNVNANAYRGPQQAQVNTAYGGVAPGGSTAGGTLRATGAPQIPSYNTARGSYPSPTPTPTQGQSLYGGSGSIIRPTNIAGNLADSVASNRIVPATAAAGLAATAAAGILPENAVGSFAQPAIAVGNREYLPPASVGQRQRGTGA